MKAFVVDDEPIAIDRMRHLLDEHPHVAVVGSQSNPSAAITAIRTAQPDVLFLDIEMPGLSGFDLLEKLEAPQPLTVFTTAYEQYALDAFKVNSIDYLLKPIERADLARALAKLERILHGAEARGDMAALLEQMRDMLARREPDYLVRLPSRTGSRVLLRERQAGVCGDLSEALRARPGDYGSRGEARPAAMAPHPPRDHRQRPGGEGSPHVVRRARRAAVEGRQDRPHGPTRSRCGCESEAWRLTAAVSRRAGVLSARAGIPRSARLCVAAAGACAPTSPGRVSVVESTDLPR